MKVFHAMFRRLPQLALSAAGSGHQRALLEEVRQLRAAVQRTNLSLYRAQMLNDQIARQQTRVDSLTEEIEQLKKQVQQSLDTTRDDDELKELEATIGATSDPQQRLALTQSLQSMKRAMERQREYNKEEVGWSHIRQQQLENSLRIEQAKLSKIQEQLEALDRELERQLSETRKVR